MPGAIEREDNDKGLPVYLIKLFLEKQKKEKASCLATSFKCFEMVAWVC